MAENASLPEAVLFWLSVLLKNIVFCFSFFNLLSVEKHSCPEAGQDQDLPGDALSSHVEQPICMFLP